MKTILNVSLFLASLAALEAMAAPSGKAADPRGSLLRQPDECGDPRMVSQVYELHVGTVVSVSKGDTVVVDIRPLSLPGDRSIGGKRAGRTIVRLVGIDAPGESRSAATAREELAKAIVGKEVQIEVSPVQKPTMPLTVMLKVGAAPGIDVAEQLLAKGLVKYRDFGAYAIDWWLRCHYERAEARAKAAGLGVWAKPS
jgi:endonuclease YncB( thermonuclease family)